MASVKFSRLKTALLTSGLQISNNALFQVINELIGLIEQFQSSVSIDIGSGGGGGGGGLVNATYITVSDETGLLANSSQLLAGLGITLDTSVPNQVTISVSNSSGYWAPLTDGNVDETDLIFVSGEAIMVFVPV